MMHSSISLVHQNQKRLLTCGTGVSRWRWAGGGGDAKKLCLDPDKRNVGTSHVWELGRWPLVDVIALPPKGGHL